MKKIKTVTFELTIGQAENLLKYLKPLADSIEGKAVGEVRPMTGSEDLAVNSLSWIYVCLNEELKKVNQDEILQEQGNYNRAYREDLKRQSKEN